MLYKGAFPKSKSVTTLLIYSFNQLIACNQQVAQPEIALCILKKSWENITVDKELNLAGTLIISC